MSSTVANGHGTEHGLNNTEAVGKQNLKSHSAAQDKSLTKARLTQAVNLTKIVKVPNEFILHLNSLLSNAADMSSNLSILAYTFGILALFYEQSRQLKHRLCHAHLSAPQTLEKGGACPNISALADLFWRARLTLRLFGLLPLYAKALQLWRGRDAKEDRVLFVTAMMQCLLYGTSHVLESLAFLTDSRILSKRLTLRWTEKGSTIPLYTLAYRAWFLGVSCDVMQAFRKLQLMEQRVDQADNKSNPQDGRTDAQWYTNYLVHLAWFPIGWQLSGWAEDRIPGFNIGLHGAASVLHDLENTALLWRSSGSHE